MALQKLSWEVLQHLLHSQDLSLTDYHLIRRLLNEMRGFSFKMLENWLYNFFETQPKDFWRNEIKKTGGKLGRSSEQ